MQLWLQALLLGLLSGLSLPLGAFLGQSLSPVREDVVAGFMAFGAGALLFAVTVELYGESLHNNSHLTRREAQFGMTLMVVFAAIGAWSFLYLNRCLEQYIEHRFVYPTPHMEQQHMESSPLMCQRGGHAESSSVDRQRGGCRARSLVELQASKRTKPGLGVAFGMWLGVFVDGLPEGVLLGFLAAKYELHSVLVLSLFIANFPEAFASASIMAAWNLSRLRIVGMWTAICVITGLLCSVACLLLTWVTPSGQLSHEANYVVEAVEGLTAGAMLSCIANVMLPEAFQRSNKLNLSLSSGFLCTSGFLTAVLIKIYGGEAHEWFTEASHVLLPEPAYDSGPDLNFLYKR